MPKKLRVALGKRSYDVVVGDRLLPEAGTYIKTVCKSDFVIIVSDENTARFYLHRLTNALEEAHIRYRSVLVRPGESTKSLRGFSDLIEKILEHKPDRATMLIALGGGVVGDITGFAASVLLRGVPFVQIPTTLLAQVDSSVGGKTGINSARGKNLIGTFHQPSLVLCDASTLATLPERELRAGYAEIVKYALINNRRLFEWLETNGRGLLKRDAALLSHAVIRSCTAKSKIVAADERESGVRALLNFGHTFAHALEAETGYTHQLLHGEAVAIGMIMAFDLSVRARLCRASEMTRVKKHFKKLGLHTSLLDIRKHWDANRLMQHFSQDKKAKGDTLTFILTRGIGKAFIAEDVEKSLVMQTLVEFGASV